MELRYCSKSNSQYIYIYIFVLTASKCFGRFISCLTIYYICAYLRWVCCMHECFRAHMESTHLVAYRENLECCVPRDIYWCSTYILVFLEDRERLPAGIYARFPWVLRSASFWLLLLFNFWLHCAESLEGNSMWSSPHPERQHHSWCYRYIFTFLSTLHMIQSKHLHTMDAHVLICDWTTQVLPTVDGGIITLLLVVRSIYMFIYPC